MRYRPRRIRSSNAVRTLVQENRLHQSDLVMPLFIVDGTKQRQPIPAMPGIDRLSVDLFIEECKNLADLGIQAVAPFPVVEESLKNSQGSEAYKKSNFYHHAVRSLKKALPNMLVITDVALDPYNSDGHDGLVGQNNEVQNDETLDLLAAMAVCQAEAGADMVAPSDMMDGRVAYIRSVLDDKGLGNVGIISYSAKYASAYYGPFRSALDSFPTGQNQGKESYQINPANVREALWEADLDIHEGADILLVKPGLAYLDVLYQIQSNSPIPVAVYNVSGEYAMLQSIRQNQDYMMDYQACVLETLLAFKRSGADFIFTYHAREAAAWLQ